MLDDYEQFRAKYSGVSDHVIGAVTECEEFYDVWNKIYLRFVICYVPIFLLVVYVAPFVLNQTLQTTISEQVLTVLLIAQSRYGKLLGLGDHVAFLYVSSLIMSVPAIAISCFLYSRLYVRYLRNGHNKTRVTLKRVIGTPVYIVGSALFFYFFLFFPFPLEERTSVPFMQILFGPAFPVLASGLAVTLFLVIAPVIASFARVLVIKRGEEAV